MTTTTTIREIMPRRSLVCVNVEDSIETAAQKMKKHSVGALVVLDAGEMCGILTDRDIVVRGIADGADPHAVTAGDICSRDLAHLTPDDQIDNAVELMRKKAIRRIPIMDDGKPICIISLGDLAIERDPTSALGGISSASPNT